VFIESRLGQISNVFYRSDPDGSHLEMIPQAHDASVVSSRSAKAEAFLALHRPGAPLLMPNPWDAGSATVLARLGLAVAHAAAIGEATELPVSADFENAYADDAGGVAETVRLGIQAGLAGCSVEDYTGRDENPFYELAEAKEMIAAAAEAAREFREEGTYGYHERAAVGARGVHAAFGPGDSDPSDLQVP
jgi:Phosphoenolpyruvate phosphomutase